MRYPEFIAQGETIGFPAPSFGANIEPYRTAFDHALEALSARGYEVKPGPNAYAGDGIGISSTPESCGREFTEMYCADDTAALIACGGGELACETLANVDLDVVHAAKPKWFEGYSDNTNLTFTLTTMCDVASVYGPCVSTFGMEPWHKCVEDALGMLSGSSAFLDEEGVPHIVANSYPRHEIEGLKDAEHPLAPYNCTALSLRRVLLNGEMRIGDGAAYMEGRLLGGCMDILAMLVGTRFDQVKAFNERYADDGVIWFLESCDLNPMSIRRALWQMENAGWFDRVRGFVLGRPLCGAEPFLGLDAYQAACGILEKHHVPIIMDADIGHIPPSMPLICGSFAKVSCMGNDISIEQILR